MSAANFLLLSSSHHKPLPPLPSREDVCKLRTHLMGLNYPTTQYGTFPAWFYGKLNASDRQAARNAHRGVGDRHIIIPVSEAYRKEGTLWPADLRDGYDYTNDLGTLRAIVEET